MTGQYKAGGTSGAVSENQGSIAPKAGVRGMTTAR